MTTFTKRIVAGSDDGYKVNGGSYFGTSNAWSCGGTTIGCLRFTAVSIPQGATILSAKLTLKAWQNDIENITVDIFGIDEDNTTTFSSDPTGRPLTTASASWNRNGTTGGNIYDTSDFTAVVQELVDRGGWASGNAMGFMIKEPVLSGFGLFWVAYESDPTTAALLTIEYEDAEAIADERTSEVRGDVFSNAVIKIAKDGVNVLEDPAPDELIFSSKYGTLKYFETGDIDFTIDVDAMDTVGEGAVTHGLGYIPFVEVFMLNPLGKWEYCPTFNGGVSTTWHSYVVITDTQLKVYAEISGFVSGEVDFKFKYFIYKNDLLL